MKDYNMLNDLIAQYRASGLEQEIDHDKFYLYSIVTHSTAIEGSTMSEVENQLLFDEGITPMGKSLTEQLMNLDLKEAYEHWLQWVKGIVHFTPDLLCQMSASVMRRTGTVYHTALGDFDSARGELRKVNMRAGVNGRSYMAYEKVPVRLKEFCQWLNEQVAVTDKNNAAEVYILSFTAHYRLVTIHPWVDGNGRTTRLLMNILQAYFGVPMSKVLKQDKVVYIQALVDARESEDEGIFIDKMLDLLRQDIRKQIQMCNATDNSDSVTENDLSVTDTQRSILTILREQPEMSQSKIAQRIGIHRVNVNRNIQQLVHRGMLRREGSDRKGRWIIEK